MCVPEHCDVTNSVTCSSPRSKVFRPVHITSSAILPRKVCYGITLQHKTRHSVTHCEPCTPHDEVRDLCPRSCFIYFISGWGHKCVQKNWYMSLFDRWRSHQSLESRRADAETGEVRMCVRRCIILSLNRGWNWVRQKRRCMRFSSTCHNDYNLKRDKKYMALIFDAKCARFIFLTHRKVDTVIFNFRSSQKRLSCLLVKAFAASPVVFYRTKNRENQAGFSFNKYTHFIIISTCIWSLKTWMLECGVTFDFWY